MWGAITQLIIIIGHISAPAAACYHTVSNRQYRSILPRKLRSPDEILFRLRQEFSNLRFAKFPPRLPASALATPSRRLPGLLPDPAQIAGQLATTSFAVECAEAAGQILNHRFPLLGFTVDTGPDIRWRRDYLSGIETDASYFRRIPYLDVTRAGDHKTIWELNRHQHLVLLAQAFLFSGDRAYLAEIVAEIESWLEQNPFQQSINWASALEVAFRALSWMWVCHLVGDHFEETFRLLFLEALYRHALHLSVNLSYYFAPNTHLLGEAVALHALGRLFPQFPGATRFEEIGAAVVRREIDRQVLADGCHFEKSTYYHVYALDMFLFHAILRGADCFYRDRIVLMAEFLDQILGVSGVLPYFGDDDGGRFFHPYGARERFGLATLATCGSLFARPEWIRDECYLHEQASWWLKHDAPRLADTQAAPRSRQPKSTRFADTGLVVMTAGSVQLVADYGSFGPGTAGHSHADTLSFVFRRDQSQILIDSGTYTYVADPVWRDHFRGTAAHNTVRIDGMEQAVPRGPFAWSSRPEIDLLAWKTSPSRDLVSGVCRYAPVRHKRTILFDKVAFWVVILDEVEAGEGEHELEQFWHFGVPVRQCGPGCIQAEDNVLIAFGDGVGFDLSEGGNYGWASRALGAKLPAPLVRVKQRGPSPAKLVTLIDFSNKSTSLRLAVHPDFQGADGIYENGATALFKWNEAWI